MGINLSSFSKILKCAANDDSVKISADDVGADCADFVFESQAADRVAHFQLKLMDIDAEHLGMTDDIEYTAVISMPSSEYRRIFTDLAVIGDTVTIEASKQTVTFSVEGDIGRGQLSIQPTEASKKNKGGVVMTVNEPVKMTLSGKYLTLFTKAVPISDTVTLCMEPENPLAVEFAIPEGQGFVRFFLAPKMEEEE